MKKRIASFLLALCMLLSMVPMPGHVHAVEVENVQSHDTGTDTAAVYAEGTIDLSQYSAGDTIIISNDSIIYGDGILHDVTVHITEDATVTFDVGTGGVQLLDSITVADGKTLTLLVAGDAEHTVNGGISLGNGSNVIIEGDLTKENNKLTVTATDGNAGIGANGGVTAGDITIRNARVDATGSSKEVSADSNKGIKADTSISGAAIGTSDGSMGNILIENSIIVAEGGYYEDTSHAPAIGIGYVGSTMGNITLKDSQITARNNGDGLASVIGAGANMHVYLTGTLGDIVITNTELNLSMEIGTTNYYAALIGSGGGKSYAYVNMGKIIFTDMKQEELDEVIPTWLPSDFNQYGAYALGIGYEGNVYKCGTFGGVWVSDGNGGTVQIGDESGYYIACKNGGFVHDFDEICGGTCSDCGVTYFVAHTLGTAATCTAKAVCSVCGESYGEVGGHTPNAAGYTDNGDGTHSYTCTVCGPVTEAHTGGTATSCTTQANCEHCGASYGEVDTNNHDSTVAFDSNGFCPNGCYAPAADSNADGVYEIGNAGQLFWFAQQVNSGKKSINAILMHDIDLTNHTWTPIGVTAMGEGVTDGYTGAFDGNGHVISNITFATPTSAMAAGIFGTVQSGGTVKNLGVENLTFDNNTYDHRAGGIAGQLLAGSTISDCYVINSTVKASSRVVGGIVGMNKGTVQNCYTYNMTLAAYSSRFGGISGDYSGGKLENCYTDYSALASSQAGTATNCEAGVSAERFASGEVAYLLNGDQSEIVFKQTIGTDATPNFTGETVYYGYISCVDDAEMVYTNDSSATAEKSHSYDNGFCTVCDGYQPAELVGSSYQITNAGQLYWFAAQVNSGKTSANAILTNHIVVNEGTMTADSTDARTWTPIGNSSNYYAGTFDGCGFTVSGLYFNNSGTTDVGLFGSVSGGTVKNVGVVDSYLSGKWYVGGVVGYIDKGTVEGCYNSGTVSGSADVGGVVGWANTDSTVTNCYNSGTVSGSGDYVGGVVGNIANGTVEGCYNTGNVSGTGNYVGGVAGYIKNSNVTNSYNTGAVSGSGNYVGGVAGSNEGDSFTALSDVMGCYNSGTVSGSGNHVGSVVGYKNSRGFVTNCYYLADSETDSIDDTTFKTADQFASGEVAYLLNGDQSTIVFKQTLGTDAAPNFTGGTVYQVTNCKNEVIYSNTNENIGHMGGTATCTEKKVCTVCGASYGELAAHSTTAEGDSAADCNSKAYCSACESYYGDVDLTNHDETVAYENGFCPNCDAFEPAVRNGEVYEISNAGQLYWFAGLVNGTLGGVPQNNAANAVLTADITVNEDLFSKITIADDRTAAVNEGQSVREWIPIGAWDDNYSPQKIKATFMGTFDGQGHTVSGLYFNNPVISNVSLIGDLGGVVKNVKTADCYFYGKDDVGGVVGYMEEGSLVESCENISSLASGAGAGFGGIAGSMYGFHYSNGDGPTMRYCVNHADVIGNSHVGGLVGYTYGAYISCSYNEGNVRAFGDGAAGLVGYSKNYPIIEYSYNNGKVEAETHAYALLHAESRPHSFRRCYNNADVCPADLSPYHPDSNEYVGSFSSAEFASGKVAWWLQMEVGPQTWGQNIDNGNTVQTTPVLHGAKVYRIINCKSEHEYSNTYKKDGHRYENGICTVCGTACSHTGGNATCTTQAVCTVCGESYGELAAHSTTAEGDRAADCNSKAYCSVCDSEYGEVDLTNHDETVAYVNGFCPNGCYEPAVLNGDVYEISNAGQLYWFAAKVNAVEGVFNGKLMKDITVNENVLTEMAKDTPDTSSFRVWEMNQRKYAGTFEGGEHTVSGLYFNDNTADYVGLFGYVNGGTVQNVTVIDSYFRGNVHVGGIAGYNFGTVSNCVYDGIVIGNDTVGGMTGNNRGTVKNCVSDGTITGANYSGGMVGRNYGTVESCTNNAAVTATERCTGGIAGENNSVITDCLNTGTVSGSGNVGGIVGYGFTGSVTDCRNTGTVSAGPMANGDPGGQAGGVVGCNYTESTITNCWNSGSVTATGDGNFDIGGVVGNNLSTVKDCYNTGNISGAECVGGVVGCNDGILESSYSVGTVTCTSYGVGGVAGTNYSTVTNCYYLDTTATDGFDGKDVTGQAEAKTEAQFKSGEVAYLLQGEQETHVWGQNIGTDDHPVLGGEKVYQILNCKNENAYSNTNENIGHNYVNGKCTVCEAGDPNWNSDVGVVFINEKTTIPHTVNGRTVTVDYDLPCRAGYWDEAQQSYVAIPAVENQDGGYSFTAPVGVEEVLLVITGDTNGDGRVMASDIARLNAHLKNKTVLTAKELFAADVNHDGRLDDADKSAMSTAILGISSLEW